MVSFLSCEGKKDYIDFIESAAYNYALTEERGEGRRIRVGADAVIFFLVRFLMIRWETCLFEAQYQERLAHDIVEGGYILG